MEFTGSLGLRNGGDEAHEIGTAEELCDEQGSVALCLGSRNPLQARPQNARIAATFSKNSTAVATHLQIYDF